MAPVWQGLLVGVLIGAVFAAIAGVITHAGFGRGMSDRVYEDRINQIASNDRNAVSQILGLDGFPGMPSEGEPIELAPTGGWVEVRDSPGGEDPFADLNVREPGV